MLRLDRNDMPRIPRPVYEFVFERPDVSTVRISVQVSGDFTAKVSEFPIEAHAPAMIEAWLLDLPYGFDGNEAWQSTAHEIAARAIDWARTAPIDE